MCSEFDIYFVFRIVLVCSFLLFDFWGGGIWGWLVVFEIGWVVCFCDLEVFDVVFLVYVDFNNYWRFFVIWVKLGVSSFLNV